LHQHRLVGAVGLLDLLAELIGDKGGTVEGDVVAILLLPPYPVAGHQRHQVGPSMALLHPLPVILGSNGRIMGLAADGGGIEENLRALQRHGPGALREPLVPADRKSTRLNSSHVKISYAVFCLKKKKNTEN